VLNRLKPVLHSPRFRLEETPGAMALLDGAALTRDLPGA